MRLRSLRPAYLFPRLGQMAFARAQPDAPWITRSAVVLLESWLRPSDRVVEWGSGRSTVWFAERTGHVLSIESSPVWHAKVTGLLERKGVRDRVDYRLIPCGLGESAEPSRHAYFDAVAELADESVDFALVDGELRVRCIEAVLRKLRRGALLALDNANRFVPNRLGARHSTVHEPRDAPLTEEWARVLGVLAGWRAILTTDEIWDTRFWVKP